MSAQSIPFLDLITPHRELEDELLRVVRDALRAAAFVGGPEVEAFETEFAAYCATSHCVGVGSGTDALRLALIAAGVRPGDTVVTVPNTFIATTEAISQVGARAAFVDVDERTYTMDPAKLDEYVERTRATGSRIAAVVPVHLYGQMADMDPILDAAAKHDFAVIEDACQAHGAQYFSRKEQRWRTAGSMGHAAAFSFYPGKNLGACGEAGAVTTNDAPLARTVRMLRDHGQVRKYYHDLEGYNGRLDAIQAGFLRVKLRYLDSWNHSRRAAAVHYNQLLAANSCVGTPYEPDWSKAAYHLYVIRTADRDGLAEHLKVNGISTGLHYPVPLHLQSCYRAWGHREGSFPATERAAGEILSLPMFPGLTAEQQRRVAATVDSFSVIGSNG